MVDLITQMQDRELWRNMGSPTPLGKELDDDDESNLLRDHYGTKVTLTFNAIPDILTGGAFRLLSFSTFILFNITYL